jgi:hypothetical protein
LTKGKKPMVSMTAGQLDHRNIGSHVSLKLDEGVISGALAVVIQFGDKTSITLAHDEDELHVSSLTPIEISLPPAAAYTLHLKNALEELIGRLDGRA